MSNRKLLSSILALTALAVVATGILLSSKPAVHGGASVAPYYKRTGFLSSLMLELNTSAKGVDSIHVPDGFEVTVAAGPGMVNYPMFIAFDDRGRLFVCESAGRNISDQEMDHQSEMRIRLLEDTDGDGVFDRSTIFADKISMTMGAQWYRGSLYVAAPPDVLRLTDTDGDGVADRREVLLTGWPLHSNGTTLHGPYLGPDGWMYLTYNLGRYNIKTKEGATLHGPGGRVFRFRPDGSGLEWIVGGGYDNGIEMVFTSAGEMIGTMTYYTNPKLGERDALLHYVEGGVYPKVLPIVNEYKRTGGLMPAMTKFARIAPAGLALYRGASFGREYQGNLFSAQFNPHRIQRHIVERSGATFRTIDEDFLTSDDPDFHPTDVAEDSDGSLLVVETGAWYLHSCPVSRIAKPEFKGALYRVRRKGAPRAQDPWGNALKLESRRPEELAAMLGDARPAVRDRAADLLVQAGDAASEPLIRVRESHASPEVRAAAVFALARIGAQPAVRAALSDGHFVVRIAAARMAGLARDREAVTRLMEMVDKDSPPARRQAATALGQIGESRAVPALIAASANPEDRFVEHSIIYSLITLKTPEPLVEALHSQNAKVRKAALIALDQMDNSPLERGQLASALNDSDPELRRAALWVVSRHADWAGSALDLIRARLRKGDFPDDEAEAVQQTLISFCAKADGQRMLGELLGDSSAPAREQLFLLGAMDQCPVQPFPAAWTAELRRLLLTQDTAVRARVLALARSRQLTALDGELTRLAGDERESKDLRTASLSVLVSRQPALPDSGFRFLLGVLQPDTDADLRQTASQILGRAKLTNAQLLEVARQRLPQADPLILPNLLDAFRNSRSEEVGQAMVNGLLTSTHPADGIAADRIPELLNNFPPSVRKAAHPLLARIEKEKQSRAARLQSLEPLLKGGDVDRGREVFFGARAGCSSCHTIMTDGGDVGPDLTGVGAIRSGIDLLEAIVYPSASFVPGHEVYRVETAGEIYTGVQGEGTPDAVVIISGPRDRVRIPRKDIRSMRPSPVSLMPDGFADNLTRRELSDLLAFLQSQKSRALAGVRAAGS
jgi:putative membrane-bound dehydrogenase-like protein